jgi:prefoldin subunit 5
MAVLRAEVEAKDASVIDLQASVLALQTEGHAAKALKDRLRRCQAKRQKAKDEASNLRCDKSVTTV